MRILPSLKHVERTASLIGTLYILTLFIINIVLVGMFSNAWGEDMEIAAQGVFRTVMSPYCPGRLLIDCPSGEAEKLRNIIRSEFQAGKSQEEVLKNLFDKFGESVRAAPEASGIGLLAWILPIAFPAIGIFIYIVFLKKQALRCEQ